MRILFFAVIFLFAIVVSVKADPIPMSPELKAFLMQPEQQREVLGMMNRQWQVDVGNCSNPRVVSTNVAIGAPPQFDQSGAPTSGSWRVISRFEGCGKKRIFSVQYGFDSSGQMKRIALLPGTTAAELRLQKDALMYAQMGMVKLVPMQTCKDVQYINTSFIGFGESSPQSLPGRDPRSWTEEWTVRACGVTGIVTMHFIPDAKGTAIESSPDETRRADNDN